MKVCDAQRVAEGSSQLLKLENFAGVGLLMNAMERIDAALQEIASDGAIGGQHKFFNEPVRDVALAARDIGHALLIVEFDDPFGKIEIDGAALVAAGIEGARKCLPVAGGGGHAID